MPLNAVRVAFDILKADFRDARFPVAAGRLTGESLAWGERLLALYRDAGRADLEAIDPLARFWVLRHRGMPVPADLTGATPGAGFVLAFTAFPYLDMMMEEWDLGGVAGEAGPERLSVRCLFNGVDEGAVLTAERIGGGWRFDLMPLYRDKARVFETFIAAEFGGDLEGFVGHYAAEHDLDFDMEQAWRPLAGA
ncbi:hypothetical protein [Magnetospirillum sp. SS-4]|uniref:hypothetical protein n=1 Tax=Magnetospirillum sp. SS-4 TaxID=2681465 RepID=UPI0013861E5B|nr:hypothetical protein [Magnetospirillum sp. SS-4]CAA7625094.1 conserved hypothetical protein [Magnetospirillum sp. SS-4]